MSAIVSDNKDIFVYEPILTVEAQIARAWTYVSLSGVGVIFTTVVAFMSVTDQNLSPRQKAAVATPTFIAWALLVIILIAQAIQLGGLYNNPKL